MARRKKGLGSMVDLGLEGLGSLGSGLGDIVGDGLETMKDVGALGGAGLVGVAATELALRETPWLRDQAWYVKVGAQVLVAVAGATLLGRYHRGLGTGWGAGIMTSAGIRVATNLLPAHRFNPFLPAPAPAAAAGTAGLGATFVDGQQTRAMLEGMGATVAEEMPQSYALNGLGNYSLPSLPPEVAATL